MKILSQKRDGNTVTLEIEETYARFQETFDRTLLEAGKELKIAGFRPGKAPRELVEKSLDRDYVEHRAAQALIAEIYPQVLAEGKLEPVDYPNIEITQLENGKPVLFKAVIEVYPTVKLGKYKGLKVEKRSAVVSEEEIDKFLGNLQERFAVREADGKRTVLPLDDSFAQKVSKFGTLAELRAEIRLATERERVAEVDSDLKNQLIAALVTACTVEIPKAMVEREIEVLLDELKVSLAQSGLTVADYLKGSQKTEQSFRDEMRPTAEGRVKGKVALQAVVDAEKLTVSDDEVKAEIKQAVGGVEPPAGTTPQVTPELIK